MTAGLLIASLSFDILLLPALILGAITLGCYLRAPVAFDLSLRKLTIVFRFGEKQFAQVSKVSRVEGPLSLGIRLWGNGGLFAGTGIFWNKKYGIFRAYVTRGKPADLVLVETPDKKVIISPENPERFVSRGMET
ncbi:MAG TPA: PH domain-containing protein [Nitrospiria bacterium]|nr:PH domain-containing protein [Nitrospiria bacterium]